LVEFLVFFYVTRFKQGSKFIPRIPFVLKGFLPFGEKTSFGENIPVILLLAALLLYNHRDAKMLA